jgi:hypothetical protein
MHWRVWFESQSQRVEAQLSKMPAAYGIFIFDTGGGGIAGIKKGADLV